MKKESMLIHAGADMSSGAHVWRLWESRSCNKLVVAGAKIATMVQLQS